MENAYAVDTDQMYTNLNTALAALSQEDCLRFCAYLSAYMQCTAECVWIDMACKVINGYVSDDTALYFALWLIAQGEATLLAAFQDPDSLATLPNIPFEEAEFEMLLAIGMDIDRDTPAYYETIAACIAEIAPTIVYKENNKNGNYKSFEAAMADIPTVLPNLLALAKKGY